MIIVSCRSCGYVLHKANELIDLNEIYQKNHGACPKCKSPLNNTPSEVKVEIKD